MSFRGTANGDSLARSDSLNLSQVIDHLLWSMAGRNLTRSDRVALGLRIDHNSRVVISFPRYHLGLLVGMSTTNESSESANSSQPSSANDAKREASKRSAPTSELSSTNGGQWRPVRPEELLLKNAPIVDPDALPPINPKLIRERRQELEHLLKSCPTDMGAYQELATIYRKENRPAEAKRVLTEAVRLFPDEKSLKWELEEATLARSLQQYREVSELAGKLRTKEMDREVKRSREDWAFRRIEVCKNRLARDPSLQNLRLVLAEAYIDSEQHDLAVKELEELIKFDEFSPQANLLKGKCLLSLGRDVEAMTALRAAGLRRAVVAPLPIRQAALRLLCETAERLGIELTLEHYTRQLKQVEQDIAKQSTASR